MSGPYVVTIKGAAGATLSLNFADQYASQGAQAYADMLAAGSVLAFTADGGALPSVPGGQTLEIIDHVGLATTLPDTVPAVLVSDAPGVATVTGGAFGGDVILSGDGGLNFTAGLGVFAAFATGGPGRFDIAPGMGGGNIWLGSGSNTVNAIGGNNQITGGTGHNLITTGIGRNNVALHGNDTVMVGPGRTDITTLADSQTSLAFLGSGTNAFQNDGGAATVVGSSGTDVVHARYGLSTLYFAGSGSSSFAGTGTVVGGSGTLTVDANNDYTGARDLYGVLVFGGSGATSVNISSNTFTDTIVGNAAGSLAVTQHQGNLVLFAAGNTTMTGQGGVATVVGTGGVLNVTGARGLFLAPPGGGSSIAAGDTATIFGTAEGDVLSAGTAPQFSAVALVGGAGAETIKATGSQAFVTFFAGSGPELLLGGAGVTQIVTGTGAETIQSGGGPMLIGLVSGQHPDVVVQGFNPAQDSLTLIGFGTAEVAGALAGAVVSGGSESLTLSDGTHILFQGLTGLTATSFI